MTKFGPDLLKSKPECGVLSLTILPPPEKRRISVVRGSNQQQIRKFSFSLQAMVLRMKEFFLGMLNNKLPMDENMVKLFIGFIDNFWLHWK